MSTAGFYNELGSGSHENKNDFKPNPITAVVVLHDPYIEKNPNVKTLVILTNGPIDKPLKVYDGYDARSEIENADKCIVFHNDRYAIFYLYELLTLSGKTVLKPHGVPMKITKEVILRKHGVLLE